MPSVTHGISQIKQPRGGYLNPKDLETVQLSDGRELSDNGNIHASLVGLAVDYLARFMLGANIVDAFLIS